MALDRVLSPSHHERMEPIPYPHRDVCAAMHTMLASLFPEGWFERETQRFEAVRRRVPPADLRNHVHPAWQRMRHFRGWGKGGAPDLADVDGLLVLAETMLDGVDLLAACGGLVRELRLGDLANYGDLRVQQRIRGAILDPRQYLDVATEIARAALHIKLGHDVTATEAPGVADLLVRTPFAPQHVAVECKRVEDQTGLGRYPDLVKKANQQIKARDPEAIGVLIIDVTSKARVFVAHRGSRPIRRFHIPAEVNLAMDALRSSVSGQQNKSVGVVVLVWNEVRSRPEGTRAVLSIGRRTRVLVHRNPRQHVPDDLLNLLERGAGGFRMSISPLTGTMPDDQYSEILRRHAHSRER